MVAPRNALVEINAVELRRCPDPDIAFLDKFARERLKKGLSCLHATAREMPATDVRMFDQKYAARPVDNHGPGAQCRGTRKPPIKMHSAADHRFERAAKAIEAHRIKSRAQLWRCFIERLADR